MRSVLYILYLVPYRTPGRSSPLFVLSFPSNHMSPFRRQCCFLLLFLVRPSPLLPLLCSAGCFASLVVARRPRLLQTRDIHATRGKSLLVLALTAVAALVWVVKSLFEVEVRMNKIEGSTEEIVDSLLRVRI